MMHPADMIILSLNNSMDIAYILSAWQPLKKPAAQDYIPISSEVDICMGPSDGQLPWSR